MAGHLRIRILRSLESTSTGVSRRRSAGHQDLSQIDHRTLYKSASYSWLVANVAAVPLPLAEDQKLIRRTPPCTSALFLAVAHSRSFLDTGNLVGCHLL